MWLIPLDVFAVVTIVATVVALAKVSSRAPLLGVLAGIGMAAETVACPYSGHHAMGWHWYTQVQSGLTAFVLLTSLVLIYLARGPRPASRRR